MYILCVVQIPETILNLVPHRGIVYLRVNWLIGRTYTAEVGLDRLSIITFAQGIL